MRSKLNIIALLQAAGLCFFLSSAVNAQETLPAKTTPAVKPSAPSITIESPVQNQKVSAPKLLVKGEVTDDGEVVSIIIGDVSLGVSGSKIPFQYPVYLKKGKNEIHIEAMDSEGNKAEQILTVYCEVCTEKAAKKNVDVSVMPVGKKKVEKKKKKNKLAAIPDLPTKSVIVKKEDYVKITPTATSTDMALKITKKEVKKVVVVPQKKGEVKETKEVTPAISMSQPAIKKSRVKKARKTRKIRMHGRYASYVNITPRIIVNNHSVLVTIKPAIKKGRTYVALEEDFISKIGVKVTYDRKGGKKFVVLEAKGKVLKLKAGSRVIDAGGRKIQLGSPLRVKNGHLIVPFRIVCEQLGYYVQWDKSTRTASAVQR